MENLSQKIQKVLREVQITTDDPSQISTIKSKMDKNTDTINLVKKTNSGITTPTTTSNEMTEDAVQPTVNPTDASANKTNTEFGQESDIVSNFFKLLDKNSALVNAANKIKTPQDKIKMASEFIRRLKLDKAMLSRLRAQMGEAIGEGLNPKMKKKDLVDLISQSNKLKIVETIKIKNLKK